MNFTISLLIITFIAMSLRTDSIACRNPKFIILGLQKAGTTSFQDYFTKIGLKSAHYLIEEVPVAFSIYKAKLENKPLFNYLQSFDAITEINFDSVYGRYFTCYYPQIDDFHQILAENPDAVFILNSRDINKQVSSMLRSETGINIIRHCRQKYLYKSLPSDFKKNRFSFRVLLYNWIDSHNKFLRNYFSNHPEYNFVDFNIESGNLQLLKPYLNLTIEQESIPFPLANINPANA